MDEVELTASGVEQAAVDQVVGRAGDCRRVVCHDGVEDDVTAIEVVLREVVDVVVLADMIASPLEHADHGLGAVLVALDAGLPALGLDGGDDLVDRRHAGGLIGLLGLLPDEGRCEGIGDRHETMLPLLCGPLLRPGKLTIRRRSDAVNWKI